MIEHLTQALWAILNLQTIALMSVGAVAGLIAGAIPGFTIAMAIVLTLPFTFGMDPAQGLATMMGVIVGGLSGGLMSGILIGVPGTPSSIATTFDGFPMARSGRPGLALGLGVWSSFFGGVISAIVLVSIAPPLAQIGLEFQPWDYFSLILFALTITVSLAGDNMVKGLIAGAAGLLLATVGEYDLNGVDRFTFGSDYLQGGFSFLPVLIGLFAFSQLLSDVRDPTTARQKLTDMGGADAKVNIEHLAAIRQIARSWVNLVRSSLIGVFVGVLPAAGSSISNILAYDQAKKASGNSGTFGKGDPDGIIAPESANNATAGGALITMMALGIPGDIVTAVMLGALLIHDIVPSPKFIVEQPVIAYSLFIAYFFANFIVLGLQSITLRLFVLVTRLTMYVLVVVVLAYCAIGVFALKNQTSDLWTLLIFGALGYVMRNFGFPLAPMILGVILGPIAERWLARAITLSSDPMQFITHAWSLFFLILAVFSICFPFYQRYSGKHAWTRLYTPALLVSLAVPLVMMGGVVRPAVAGLLVLAGIWFFVRGKGIATHVPLGG